MSCTTTTFCLPQVGSTSELSSAFQLKRKYSCRVKRACENCKKAKRCCDNGRPCTRCLRLGIESSCRDAARKNKGDVSTPDQSPTKSKKARTVESPSSEYSSPLSDVPTPNSPQVGPSSLKDVDDSDFAWILNSASNSILNEQPLTSNVDGKFRLLIDELNYFKMAALLRRQLCCAKDEEEIPFETYDQIIQKVETLWTAKAPQQPLFRVSPGETGVWLIMGGRIMDWNQAACAPYGFTSQDMTGSSWKDFFAPPEHLLIAKLLANAWKSGQTECTGVFSVVDSTGKLVVSQVNFTFLQSQQNPKMFPRFLLCCLSPL